MQFLDRSLGWKTIAGQDSKKSRYLLVYNASEPKGQRAAILVAIRPRASQWSLFEQGELTKLTEVYESLGSGEDYDVC